MKNRSYIIFLLIFGMAFMQSCDDFLDINEDPNNPTDARVIDLLPTTQLDLAGALGASTGGLGNFTSMYMHHTVQRGTEQNDYAFKGDDFGVQTPWNILYPRALTDIREIIEKGTAEEAWAYVGIAKIMKGYIFSTLVDMWGDVPYIEANLGASTPFPNYDEGQAIYDAVLALLDEGVADLQKESSLSPLGDDLFYGGDLEKWMRFSNTLKLKMYTQMRLVRDVSSEVTNLINSGNLFRDAGDDFEMQYGTGSSPSSRNPAYVQEWAPGGAFNYISPYFYEIMLGINTFYDHENPYQDLQDPRIPYYFYNQLATADDSEAENPCAYCPSRTNTPFLSIFMFSFNIDPNEGFDQSSSQTVMGLYPVGGAYDNGSGTDVNFNGVASTPQRLLTYYAQKYLMAELALMGVWNGDARAEFEAAMVASFAKVNEIANAAGAPLIEQSEIDAYIAEVLARYDAADQDGKLEHIMTQKWIATFGFGVDAYTDYRRTGYPLLHDGNQDNLNVTQRGRDYPLSFPYIIDELNRNPNAPDAKILPQANVFWDPN